MPIQQDLLYVSVSLMTPLVVADDFQAARMEDSSV